MPEGGRVRVPSLGHVPDASFFGKVRAIGPLREVFPEGGRARVPSLRKPGCP